MRLTQMFGAAAGAAVILLGGLPAQAAPGDAVHALTANGALVSFAPGTPGTTTAPVMITGLNAGETIVGIDIRPATNQLYGLGSSSQVYRIDPASGVATKIGSPFTPALDGSQVGFDFNPTVDRIRVVTDSGQDLRLHPETGAVVAVDGMLAYKAGDTNASVPKAIAAAAYTNPDNDPATGTTLFDIDAANAVLVRQDPPNDGVLSTVGALGVATSQQVAFDIGPVAGALMASRPNAGTGSHLYRVDLSTGAATDLGAIGDNLQVTGIAIRLDAAPAPAASPTATVRAPMPPNTGTGTTSVSESVAADSSTWVLAAGGVSLLLGGAALAMSRRSSGR